MAVSRFLWFVGFVGLTTNPGSSLFFVQSKTNDLPTVKRVTSAPESFLLAWNSRLDGFSSMRIHELSETKESTVPSQVGKTSQICVWRKPGKERICTVFRSGRVDQTGKFRGRFQAYDLAFDGTTTYDASYLDPFRKRAVGLGKNPQIDFQFHNCRATNFADLRWPIWVKPKLYTVVSTAGLDDYVKIAEKVTDGGEEMIEHVLCRKTEFQFADYEMETDSPTTNVIHQWWLVKDQGFCPKKVVQEFTNGKGIRFRITWVVEDYWKTDDGFFYPKTYRIEDAHKKSDTSLDFVISGTHLISVKVFEVDEYLGDEIFQPQFLPGIPVHVRNPESELESAFVTNRTGERITVYTASTTPKENRRDVIQGFIAANKDDLEFQGTFEGLLFFDDWSKTIGSPAPDESTDSPNDKFSGLIFRGAAFKAAIIALGASLLFIAFRARASAKRNIGIKIRH